MQRSPADVRSPSDPTGEPPALAPSITLPKGGGAIRGIGEKFAANPVTGTGSMTIPIATSPGRSGFGPQLALSYDSGAGNGSFGFGWNISLPSITRKTDKGLPLYLDSDDSDVFVLSGAEDLVPVLQAHGMKHDDTGTAPGFTIRRYRPRIEGLFARIERWTRDDGDVHWRSLSRDNILTLYGLTNAFRIVDPEDPRRIFSWLICETRDDRGNAVLYDYKPEDGAGVDLSHAHERNRGRPNDSRRAANRYLKSVRYGNRQPLVHQATGHRPRFLSDLPASQLQDTDWLFEVVFDYGDHHLEVPRPDDAGTWPHRADAFSSYRSGFEVRTTRLCQRALMFHHFEAEAGIGRNCLVRSTEFSYSSQQLPPPANAPIYTFLLGVTQSGFTRSGPGYQKRSLPPVEFTYSPVTVQDTVEDVDPASLEHLSIGVDGSVYQWTDLHGEGLPGILSEQQGEWYYKRNLSPISERPLEFAPQERVALKPNTALAGGAQVMDLAGDGLPDLVTLDGSLAGLYEHDTEEGWQPFQPFTSRLNVDFRDPNLRLVDLNGDGHADVLITEDDALVWHPSLAEEGFGAARRISQALDEETGPRVVFADGTQSVFLADLTGDGLSDIVRICNGEVCYWPSLGYGRFGAKVTMDNAPWFDSPDGFDHRRLRLADIDGSGTTDLIYLHGNGVRLYFNQCGNSWSPAHPLKAFPRVDDLASIMVTDLLGNGTACLVWSSALPGDASRPMRYVNLMGAQKPHLLIRSVNNLGAETNVHYEPSTTFYLRDRRDGHPWITRLPFPVHVVERVETVDHISRNRFISRSAYHHGYFDGEEREFRGFGMVEQWDTEEIGTLTEGGVLPVATNLDPASQVPPVHTKTWFHTGASLGGQRISHLYAHEYFGAPSARHTDIDPGMAAFEATLLPDTVLPANLTPDEEREACRALKGSVLRQEVYADDAPPGSSASALQRAATPYTITEQNFSVQRLQTRAGNRHAVFLAHSREAITAHLERTPADPRFQHALTLEVDPYGNVLRQVAVGYGRFQPDGSLPTQADRDAQTRTLLTYTENLFTNAIDDVALHSDVYRTPLPCEASTFEITGLFPEHGAPHFSQDEWTRNGFALPASAADLDYERGADQMSVQKRLIERVRTLYREDDLSALLPLRRLEPLALPGESYKLAFTPGLLTQVYQRAGLDLLQNPAAVLGGPDQGGYVLSETLTTAGLFPASDRAGHWWIPSGRVYLSPNSADTAAQEFAHARHHFFLPCRSRNPFHTAALSTESFSTYDGYNLLLAETRDALGNRVTVEANDYRVLQPRLVSDPNHNQTEVAFDTLGLVVGTAVMGKPVPAPVEGDTLSGFLADLTPLRLTAFFDAPDPHTAAPALLQGATTRVVYDLDRFWRTQRANPGNPAQWQAPCAATLVRETHVSDPLPPHGLRIQLSFSYSDGFGREIQKKIQAEPGRLDVNDPQSPIINPRWVGSGWTIFNNKGQPVRQYEPFFSATHVYEYGAMAGVSPVLFYDPAGRVVATLHPNHTYEKVAFDPWQQTTWDVNDTSAPRNAQTGDPRTDPDIGGYVAEYFKAQPAPWLTWHDQRIGGALGPDERAAAVRAEAHADTPITAHFDALGRPFLTVARNRVVCPSHDLDGTEESYATRVELDIEGNQRAVRDAVQQAGDPRGRIVMQYAYDMLGSRVWQLSMEAGARWMLNDVSGQPIRAWDSRGHTFTTTYDALHRPLEQVVRGTSADSDPRTLGRNLLVDRIEYGEVLASAEALNLRARVYRHFDSAGVATNASLDATDRPTEAHDFKGNLLRSTRRLVSDYKEIPDWQQNLSLDAEFFESSTRYDALNRPIQSIAPHGSVIRAGHPNRLTVIQPVFNEANLLERVDVWLERAAEPATLLDPTAVIPSPVGVANIDYDAKGQRQHIDYKNGVSTVYSYDPLTFRLTQLLTRRTATASPGDDPQPPDAAWPGRQLQNLRYTYDPAGNITHIQDDAQQTIFFKNRRVEPSNDYTYDALYRLIQASGREHLGQGGAPIAHSHGDVGRVGLVSADAAGRFAPNDGNAMGTYVERYVYDAVGNFLQMQHRGGDPIHAGWTRAYDYLEVSLTEPAKHSNRLSRAPLESDTPGTAKHFGYDAHGNMTRMPHLPLMQWDYRDQLQATAQQVVSVGTPETTWYVYAAAGQRVRKVTELQAAAGQTPGRKHERLYLGGFEMYREYEPDSTTLTLERETLHVMDNKQRVALVETRTLDMVGNDQAPRQLIRYQLGNPLGSAISELDQQAQIISYEEYAPYGSSTYQAVRSRTETAKRYRYTGKERDVESGLYFHEARYYSVWIARWTTCDPAELADGLHMYSYARGNPTIYSDSRGTQSIPPTEFLPGLITDYPHLGQAWQEAAGVSLENQFGKGSYANNMKAFHTAIEALPEGSKQTEYARGLFDKTRPGFYRRVGKLYEQGINAFGGIKLSEESIKKLKAGLSPGGNVQIDHALSELALDPKQALSEMNLGMRKGHAGVPGGSHYAATKGRKDLRAAQEAVKKEAAPPSPLTEYVETQQMITEASVENSTTLANGVQGVSASIIEGMAGETGNGRPKSAGLKRPPIGSGTGAEPNSIWNLWGLLKPTLEQTTPKRPMTEEEALKKWRQDPRNQY